MSMQLSIPIDIHETASKGVPAKPVLAKHNPAQGTQVISHVNEDKHLHMPSTDYKTKNILALK